MYEKTTKVGRLQLAWFSVRFNEVFKHDFRPPLLSFLSDAASAAAGSPFL